MGLIRLTQDRLHRGGWEGLAKHATRLFNMTSGTAEARSVYSVVSLGSTSAFEILV